MPAGDEFECECCGGAFAKAWSDEECAAEAAANFPGLHPADRATVCDPCYAAIRAWLAAGGGAPGGLLSPQAHTAAQNAARRDFGLG